VRWINLDARSGSQSGPNNAGIAAARGEVIAYLGHDDIWSPQHLERVAGRFRADPTVDFVVSGVMSHLPNGIPGSAVSGLFTKDADKHRFFVPPSGFAHRKTVIDRIGPWPKPMEVRAPVDDDLLLRAAAADLRFVSTGIVTVHKFTANARYLSYLAQESHEQEAMLADFGHPGHAARVEAKIAEARRLGRYMPPRRTDYDRLEKGQIAQQNAKRRGLVYREVKPLGRGATLRHQVERSVHDWRDRPILGIRLRAANPRPRILLPFTATGPVALTLRVVHPERGAFGPLDLLCNGLPVTAQPTALRRSLWGWTALYRAEVVLQDRAPSILQFQLSKPQQRRLTLGSLDLGFGIGPVRLLPLES
jgi:glycosyltransferase involved in cell wall biosynthesis